MATHLVRSSCRLSVALNRLQYYRPVKRYYSISTDINENNDVVSNEKSHPNTFHGISSESFSPQITSVLMAPVTSEDIEIKPDGLIYLPEIMYRRILNKAFGPGGWALMPRGDTLHYQNDTEGAQLVAREYALYCQGRYVSQSLGEHIYYSKTNLHYGMANESAKSNALMRCCKDLGIASELWDPKFVSWWKSENAVNVWCENQRTKEKKKLWKKKSSNEQFAYPWKEIKN